MSLSRLKSSIHDHSARLAVIGLGYVGLPVACEFARAGFDVLGIEIIKERVEKINQGISPIEGEEPGLAELLVEVVSSGRLHASDNYAALLGRDVILIDVETPVDYTNVPRYNALRSALSSLGEVLQPGALVIIESTIAPGTMEQLVLPLLAETSGLQPNQDFYLGNCPERVMPGKLLANLRHVSRVVGGMTAETAAVMVDLYRQVVQADLDATDCVTAELVKTVENAYRDVQIAFANEVALICEAVGADVWEVRHWVNKSPYRQMHLPGAGVGGHCIPKDPWLLAYGVKDLAVPLNLIPAARSINDGMPRHMAELAEQALRASGREISGARILVMGYAYLEDSDDTRNSPSASLVEALISQGAQPVIHDPHVEGYKGDLLEAGRECEAVIVMVKHSAYRDVDMRALRAVLRCPILIDGRQVYDRAALQDMGWIYRGVGQADRPV